ncbi:MAG: prepilin-type N-terminal cleavage/methylation domain-containing protein [Planctomycetes bacterium]|nr:prepilin-type N-terminal cleavage/methylation domain-containing protein [Planctomycetota bacterium]
MTALNRIRTIPGTKSRAFTLTELIVVIAIIVLLVGLLLGALGQARKKAKETATMATMRGFAAACEAFHQEHDFYPGVVPETILANDPKMTGTQNALLHLLGGYTREADGAAEYAEVVDFDIEIAFDLGDGELYRIKVERNRIGDGPIIGNKPYPPYFTPTSKDFGIVDGQLANGVVPEVDNVPGIVPTLRDSWGQPILYFRRLRSVGPLVALGGAQAPPQFTLATAQPYLDSPQLGRLGRDQLGLSNLGSATQARPGPLFAKLLEHPALAGQARGAFMLLSAGADAIFMSSEDGPGSPGVPNRVWAPVGVSGDGLPIFEPDYSADTLLEYDDLVQFGGS